MLSEDVAAKLCTKSSSFFVASTAPSVLKTRGAQQSPATFDEHEGDTITEHRFVNVLSSPCSSW